MREREKFLKRRGVENVGKFNNFLSFVVELYSLSFPLSERKLTFGKSTSCRAREKSSFISEKFSFCAITKTSVACVAVV
jgi:hypothetical protein